MVLGAVLILPVMVLSVQGAKRLYTSAATSSLLYGQVAISPEADTMVYKDRPSTNYGYSKTLEVSGSPVKSSYLRFDLNDPKLIGKTITSAKLRFKVFDGSTNTQNVKYVDNTTWSEISTSYNNRPASNPTVVAYIKSSSAGNWNEVNLTNFVTKFVSSVGLKKFSLAIDSTGSDGLIFYSKENPTDKPQLVVSYSYTPGGPSAPTACTPTTTGGLDYSGNYLEKNGIKVVNLAGQDYLFSAFSKPTSPSGYYQLWVAKRNLTNMTTAPEYYPIQLVVPLTFGSGQNWHRGMAFDNGKLYEAVSFGSGLNFNSSIAVFDPLVPGLLDPNSTSNMASTGRLASTSMISDIDVSSISGKTWAFVSETSSSGTSGRIVAYDLTNFSVGMIPTPVVLKTYSTASRQTPLSIKVVGQRIYIIVKQMPPSSNYSGPFGTGVEAYDFTYTGTNGAPTALAATSLPLINNATLTGGVENGYLGYASDLDYNTTDGLVISDTKNNRVLFYNVATTPHTLVNKLGLTRESEAITTYSGNVGVLNYAGNSFETYSGTACKTSPDTVEPTGTPSLVGYWNFDNGLVDSVTGTSTFVRPASPPIPINVQVTPANYSCGNARQNSSVPSTYGHLSMSGLSTLTNPLNLKRFTISLFYNPQSTNAQIIDTDVYEIYGYSLNYYSSKLTFCLGYGNCASPTITLTANTWYHMVASYDGMTIKLTVYDLLGNQLATSSFNYVGGLTYLGANNKISLVDYSNGIIDNLKIYKDVYTNVTDMRSCSVVPTSTPIPTIVPTSTPVPPTSTPIPPTSTPIPPTSTPVPSYNLNMIIYVGPTAGPCHINVPCSSPLVGESIDIYSTSSGKPVWTTTLVTDANGQTQANLPPGSYIAQSKGYDPLGSTFKNLRKLYPTPFSVVAGQVTNLELSVDSGLR